MPDRRGCSSFDLCVRYDVWSFWLGLKLVPLLLAVFFLCETQQCVAVMCRSIPCSIIPCTWSVVFRKHLSPRIEIAASIPDANSL